MFHINDYEENFRSVYVARGKDYYNRGRVSLEDIYDDRYYFKVVGTHRYNVMIQMDDDKMVHHYFCNCPCDFECKHVCGALEYLKKDNEKEMEKPNSNKQKFDRENFVALYNSSVLLTYPYIKVICSPPPALHGLISNSIISLLLCPKSSIEPLKTSVNPFVADIDSD